MTEEFLQIVFEGKGGLPKVRDCLSDYLREVLTTASPEEVLLLEIALNEALNNAMKVVTAHEDSSAPPSRRISVTMYVKQGKALIIRVKDPGEGFPFHDYISQADEVFRTGELPESGLWAESGRGILLMRAGVDKLTYNKKGNVVTLQKRLHH